jgi:hypothetical protein
MKKNAFGLDDEVKGLLLDLFLRIEEQKKEIEEAKSDRDFWRERYHEMKKERENA